MKRNTERIVTTHAGSLPRPQELRQLMWNKIDGKPVDARSLERRVAEAIEDVVGRQLGIGIDVVSDGEMGKFGFSNYILEHYSGFGEPAPFAADDLAEFPELVGEIFGRGVGEHLVLPVLTGPVERRERDWIVKEIDDLASSLDGRDPDDAFICAVTPGQVAFNFPNQYYPSHEEYVTAAADALRHEYEAIVSAGFNLQLDAPDLAMAAHSRSVGSDLTDFERHLELSIEVLNDALGDLPPEKIRLHVCWGNYRGPHHKDIELRKIIQPILRSRAGFIYVEGANPRHEHEWEVWKEVELPEDKALIVGVIDTKTNHVEHPRLIAQRLERLAGVIGKERLIAGTDCGFETFVGFCPCDSRAAWLKLEALVQGAALASERLW